MTLDTQKKKYTCGGTATTGDCACGDGVCGGSATPSGGFFLWKCATCEDCCCRGSLISGDGACGGGATHGNNSCSHSTTCGNGGGK